MSNKLLENSFIDFLRICLDESCFLPESVRSLDWQKLLQWAQQQAIVGVIFNGIERAGSIISIPRDELLQWIGHVQQIEQHNRLLNKRCVELCELFSEQGLGCCILKGQGNAMMYPYPLRRSSGDIDVWTQGKSIKETIQFAHEKNPKGKACYHHVDYGLFKDMEVELHYRPTFMNNLVGNRRLQRWIIDHENEQFKHFVELPNGGHIAAPSWDFNVVFQLSHIYRHVIQGGIGLRQIIDYYYLLKSDDRSKKEDMIETLRFLGLCEIAGAVMWVLKDVLGMKEDYLIAPTDEKRGRFFYEEIMQGGNFGHYDKRVRHSNSALQRNLNRLKQDIRLVRFFPSECLWEPVFRIYHFFWRLVH